MKVKKVLNNIWEAFTWLARGIRKLITIAIKFLPGLREGFAKWIQTVLFYMALGAMVLITSLQPMPLCIKALSIFGFAILLSFATVIRVRSGFSEKDIQTLQNQKAKLEIELRKQHSRIHKLQADIQNQQIRMLDMNWVWEVNLAQVRISRTNLFDYFIRGKERCLWNDRPKEIKKGDKRAIGALKINYISKIGIDLKQVLVHYDRQNNFVEYWIPEPYQTGAIDPSSKWIIRATLEYSKGSKLGVFHRDWRWKDEEESHTLPLWEDKKTEYYQDAFTSQSLRDELGTAIRQEADRRLKSFFETLLGCEVRAIPREKLRNPDTLGQLLPVLLRENYPAADDIADTRE